MSTPYLKTDTIQVNGKRSISNQGVYPQIGWDEEMDRWSFWGYWMLMKTFQEELDKESRQILRTLHRDRWTQFRTIINQVKEKFSS